LLLLAVGNVLALVFPALCFCSSFLLRAFELGSAALGAAPFDHAIPDAPEPIC
jgi:hypothetical protein